MNSIKPNMFAGQDISKLIANLQKQIRDIKRNRQLIDAGVIAQTVSANTKATQTVSFNVPFDVNPAVTVTSISLNPDSIFVSVSNVTATTFDITFKSTAAGTVRAYYIAYDPT